jgi:ribosomal protein S18 acetylase RimI-like enzyme
MKLIETYNIKDYEKIINSSLLSELGPGIINSIDRYCNKVKKDTYWKMYLLNYNNENIGITGIYSLEDTLDELWLGWFGLNENYRGLKISEIMLQLTIIEAKKLNCNFLKLYTSKNNKIAQNLYKKYNFKFLHTVNEEVVKHQYNLNDFGFDDYELTKNISILNDFVFIKNLREN